jgi:YD repeat-containing protein
MVGKSPVSYRHTSRFQSGTRRFVPLTCPVVWLLGRVRWLAWLILPWILSATNPENGVTQYQYDAEGNFIAKLDARGAVMCAGEWNSGTLTCDGSGVDGLGRIVKKKYVTPAGVGATAEVIYCYDGRKPVRLEDPARVECAGSVIAGEGGLLTGVGNVTSRTEYEHDVAGRVTKAKQITHGSSATDSTRAVEYQYHASDRISETKLPSGRRVVECIDTRLRLIWASAAKTVSDCVAGAAVATNQAYVSGAEYAENGALAKWTLGNGLAEVLDYNARLQVTRKRIGVNGTLALQCNNAADDELCLEWDYGGADNNGNVKEARQWVKKTAGGFLNLKTLYGYDSRNRLETANELVVSGGTSGGSWSQTNGYDRYGNRWATSSGIGQSDWTPQDSSYVNAATNRLTKSRFGGGTQPVTYDAAGFLTGHPHVSRGLVYDAEGRLVSAGGATYSYDG